MLDRLFSRVFSFLIAWGGRHGGRPLRRSGGPLWPPSPTVWGLAFVLVVAALAVALNLQGWRSRIPAFDMLPHITNARNLVATGALPVHGDTGSYGSNKPPGTAWLMVPSTLLFADPRLAEYVSTALLHFATLLGVFLLARAYFGPLCAGLAVLLYGLSEHGLFLAGSLWPNGRPDFYVWIIYLASRWVKYNNARYLAAALTIWGIAMYVDMGIAPALFIIPALWLFYRPRVRLRPLLVGGALVLLAWTPYLQFELGRGFADMRSQLLLQPIFPSNYRDAWCNPDLTLATWGDGTDSSSAVAASLQPQRSILSDPLGATLRRSSQLKEKLLSNFANAVFIPGADLALALLALSSMAIVIIAGPPLDKAKLLVIGLGVPWLILVMVAEPGKPERFWWIWPLQVIFLSAFVTYFLPRLVAFRPLVWACQLLLVVLLVGNPTLQSRADAWLRTGWAGSDAEQIQMVDYVAGQIRADGRERAAIGYQTLIYPFMAEYNIVNSQYKVGAEIDLLFRYRAGLSNANLCAEGVAPEDEYRIVQVEPQADEWAPRQYFDIRLDDSFRLLGQFGSYQVFKREANTKVMR